MHSHASQRQQGKRTCDLRACQAPQLSCTAQAARPHSALGGAEGPGRGGGGQVRRLASACLARLFLVGDVLPLFARVAAFQASLGSREALTRALLAPVRAGLLQARAQMGLALAFCACTAERLKGVHLSLPYGHAAEDRTGACSKGLL